ncbi:pentatricopeptide repeat-containing protein At2g13420, mitochondrial-like [Dioscorea cayenensis subsp. rotundata]|uniref:Pentatricopeptide repeat-containing protein At2g13420, mitochondrial-like n=1 Tax=Dioscorea cayennensis subsp. rotundata TaxID=55577 RepID=A0AB40C0Z6_DIOCR|nr:pentatricopeptide repeat-containing protein At2g13420, mitochondrial-like [Dioscorea cayenensis subsp. rotundata]XP_039133402.1 pentatricopeptide repeat-containing protein At2g13420, mitochondrial-like [Dioscorea cayenensis subsp. rotundata]
MAFLRPSSTSLRFLSHFPNPQLGLGLGLGFQAAAPPAPKPTPPPLLPSATADALARLLIQHHNPFHAMESSLQLSGVGLTHDLVLQTLLRLKNASKVALGFFLCARDHAHHLHDADAYDLMVDILGRVRQFDVVWQLIVEMDQRGVVPSPRTFAVLVRRYVAAGFTRQAIRAFDDMPAFIGREPDGSEFNMLLDTLCKYGYPKVATEIFNKRKSSFEPDEKAYTIMIYGWCKVKQPEMARKFLNEMADCGLEPNVVTYNVLLNGICRRGNLQPETRFDRVIQAAEDLLEEMRSRGIEPDVTSYSIILHVYTRAHKPELSICKFRSMKDKGICPTVATYTSVIKCLASCGRLEEAEELLSEMTRNGVSPSPAAYNCFFKEYRGRNDADGALKLYKKIKEMGSGSKLDFLTYNILIKMFLKLDKMGIVRELWKDMGESGFSPDLDSYTQLIHGLCNKQKWREACQFFMEMIEKGLLPQKITFETLYRGLIQADMLRTWRRLKKRVEEESHTFAMEFKSYQFQPYKR